MKLDIIKNKLNNFIILDNEDKKVTEYINVKCKKCNKIEKHLLSNLLQGYGCRACGSKKKYNFFEKIPKEFDYDLSETIYVNKRTKIKYICPVHGVQEQLPENHIKYGCGQCGISKASIKRRVPIENLIKRFNEIHNNKYDYSKMNYVNIDTPIEIICPEHGSFFQSPYEHQKGANCPRCGGRKKTTEEFIKHAKEIHGDKYDYSKSNYINSTTKIEIVCPEHGSFFQSYVGHVLLKQNCPICSKTTYKGEEKISNYLKAMKIDFETQKTFEDCKDKRCLKFDFYIPKQNLIIEYDGEQHYKMYTSFYRTEKDFKDAKERDELKNKLLKEHNIDLIRIPYDFEICERTINGLIIMYGLIMRSG